MKPASLMKAALYGLLLVGVYYSVLTYLIGQWKQDDFSYCCLIPVVVLYLIWEKRRRVASIASAPSWIGLLVFIVAVVFFWLGELGGEYFALYFSFWVVLVGLCWIHLGWQKLKVIAFPLVVLLAMFPFPDFIHSKISVKLQLISSELGVGMLQLCGMSAYREGNVIDLGFTQLQVVDACSGLRYVIPLMILGLLLAYFFRAAFWKRAFVFLSTIPLAIVTNATRIAITGVLYKVWGQEAAEDFFHGFSAWFMFIFSFGILLTEMLILSKLGGGRLEAKEKRADSSKLIADNPETSNLNPKTKKGLRVFFEPHFIVAVFLLGSTWALSSGIEFREKIPIKQQLAGFPVQLGEWSGIAQGMEQQYIERLDLSDYTVIDYRNPQGKNINFYVAYYESQRKGESIHSPATCLPGGGWIFKEAGSVTLPMPGHNTRLMPVNRAFMQKLDQRQLVYYWFSQRGRILNNAYQLKIFAFWDALTKHRTDGALVRLITPVYESEELQDADARLQGFMREVVPILGDYIPD